MVIKWSRAKRGDKKKRPVNKLPRAKREAKKKKSFNRLLWAKREAKKKRPSYELPRAKPEAQKRLVRIKMLKKETGQPIAERSERLRRRDRPLFPSRIIPVASQWACSIVMRLSWLGPTTPCSIFFTLVSSLTYHLFHVFRFARSGCRFKSFASHD